MTDFAERWEAGMRALRESSFYRERVVFSSPQGREAVVNGVRVLLFSSSNYLGLADAPATRKKIAAAVRRYGAGSGGSRLTTGNSRLHERLERLLADFKGSEAALLFNCGYMANVGALSSLCGKGDVIFSDALNHASIIDGCRLSGAKIVVYEHNSPDDLVEKIRGLYPSERRGLIVTDGVFSMDGDIADLPRLARIAREHGLPLMVDDAHATGVIGATGRGSLEHFGLGHDAVPIVVGTLSKAAASEGGFVCGSESLCDWLRNTARSFIFSTALAPATVAAAIAGVEHIRDHPETVRQLQDNVRHFAGRLREGGIPAQGETPVIPIVVGDEGRAKKAGEELFRMGLFIPCIRYPSVRKGGARLRVTLSAAHTRDDMDYAVACLLKVLAA
ncbi:MAG: 8-amino-7-oxononanoate synthase [Desulfovibrio sp.]|jgi:8-amino-7-oxononanoate synthase|nr:8-amino-7-oxononanoate synthase [Desulfovibrio sp.]